jgi:hypothetical protein
MVALECLVWMTRLPHEKDLIGPRKKARLPQKPVSMLKPVLKSLWNGWRVRSWCRVSGRDGSSHLSSFAQNVACTSSPSLPFRPVSATTCTSVMKEPSTVIAPLRSLKVASCDGKGGWAGGDATRGQGRGGASVLMLIAKPGAEWKQYSSLCGAAGFESTAGCGRDARPTVGALARCGRESQRVHRVRRRSGGP